VRNSPSLLFALFLPLIFAVLAAIDCGKGSTPAVPVAATASASAVADGDAGDAGADDGGGAVAMDPQEADAWARAKEGDEDDRLRLADLVGCGELEDVGTARVDLRMTAIEAMAYCRDFSELPWLAGVAAGDDDAQARAALDVVIELAARPRRAVDPEDADELHGGCAALLALARAADRPKERRVMAVRALRMLVDRGCVKSGEIPGEMDVR
jgi:hypothetical protein